MFVSANFLAIQYGVDDEIARFFADREPPANNLYWKDKLLYLRPQPGWLFIPLIVDLLYKNGIAKSELLGEEFISVMEQVGHISALEETRQLNREEAIAACRALVNNKAKNKTYFKNLVAFMEGQVPNAFAPLATPFKALHRGDIFLFALCVLTFNDDLQVKLVATWFALISTLLLLDDADDMTSDKETGDENAFLESGLTKEGLQQIVDLVRRNLRLIETLNKSMAKKLDQGYTSLYKLPSINKLLNQ